MATWKRFGVNCRTAWANVSTLRRFRKKRRGVETFFDVKTFFGMSVVKRRDVETLSRQKTFPWLTFPRCTVFVKNGAAWKRFFDAETFSV